jgi:hypothetical protein
MMYHCILVDHCLVMNPCDMSMKGFNCPLSKNSLKKSGSLYWSVHKTKNLQFRLYISKSIETVDARKHWYPPTQTPIIITIITIIGKTALFEPQLSLEVLPNLSMKSRIRPCGFHNSIVFNTEQDSQPCIQSPTWNTRSSHLCPPVTGCPQIHGVITQKTTKWMVPVTVHLYVN